MVSQRDIVIITFPFSDGTGEKARPVLVLSNEVYNITSNNFIGLAITSALSNKANTISVFNKELETGILPKQSLIKIDALFSFEQKFIQKRIAVLKKDIFENVRTALLAIIN